MKEIEIAAGERIDIACTRLSLAAPAFMVFNDTRVEAQRGDTPQDLYNQWIATRSRDQARRTEPVADNSCIAPAYVPTCVRCELPAMPKRHDASCRPLLDSEITKLQKLCDAGNYLYWWDMGSALATISKLKAELEQRKTEETTLDGGTDFDAMLAWLRLYAENDVEDFLHPLWADAHIAERDAKDLITLLESKPWRRFASARKEGT